MTTPAPDDEDSLFGSPPPSPARGRSPSPQLALPTTGSSSVAADSEKHNNVGTIALPGSQSYSELASTPAALLLSSQPTASSTWTAPAHRPIPPPPPPTKSRPVNNNAQKSKKDKGKARASRSSTPRPPPPEIPLPNPDEPPPPNFLRNSQALLGLAGLVAGVKPSQLSKRHRERDQDRGATPDHPIVVEEYDPPPIGQRSFVIQPESLPEPPSEEIVASLVKQQNIFPVLESLLRMLSHGNTLPPPPPPPPSAFFARPYPPPPPYSAFHPDVNTMLTAIWPSFANFPNHLPDSAHVTSAELLCFFIFYIIQLPLLWIHISKLRYLFAVKVVIMPIFGFTLFGWAVGRAHGFGPIFSQGSKPGSTPLAVVFFSAMTSAIAPKATLALNIADFTRYAKSPKTVAWTNIIALVIPVTLCAILGVVVTSATEVIYGVSTWNPLQVSALWSSRAAQFFSAVCWALAVIATNISANSTAVGNDLAILLPSYINVRRGQYICAILGVAACPWIVQNSATSFTNFLGGYSVFLGPVAGVMLADYWILRKRRLDLAGLYGKEGSAYWYSWGFNWRAMLAFSLALVPNLPGFALKVNKTLNVPVGASYLFSVVWPLGVIVSGSLYLLFNLISPSSSLDSPNASRTYPTLISSYPPHHTYDGHPHDDSDVEKRSVVEDEKKLDSRSSEKTSSSLEGSGGDVSVVPVVTR